MTRQEVKICGNGGQGVITMGMLLARAAAVHEGTHAVCTESYGPLSRGGDVWVEVIVDKEEPVDYPRVIKADILVTLNNQSHRTYSRLLKPSGALFYDPGLVTLKEAPGHWPIPCFRAAVEKFQRPQLANLIMLGAIQRVAPIVAAGALEKALAERFPKHAQANLEALHHGMALADEAAKKQGGAGPTASNPSPPAEARP